MNIERTSDQTAAIARAAELGAAHARTEYGRLPLDSIAAAAGAGDRPRWQYVLMAAYLDSYDIARAEAHPDQLAFPPPIAAEHKAWLRSNLVNHADLTVMLQVPLSRVRRVTEDPDWPEPVIAQPRKHWYWWPHLAPALTARGLNLTPGVTPPATGPVPGWWGNLPADPDFRNILTENLMDFGRFMEEYMLDKPTILRIRNWPDYPEPVINRPGNYWYWWADLDRFLVRHRDTLLLDGRIGDAAERPPDDFLTFG